MSEPPLPPPPQEASRQPKDIDMQQIMDIIKHFDEAEYLRHMAMALAGTADINTQKHLIAQLLAAIQTPGQEQLALLEMDMQTVKKDINRIWMAMIALLGIVGATGPVGLEVLKFVLEFVV